TETMTGMTYDNRGRLTGSTNAISETGGAALVHNYTVTTSGIVYNTLGQITGQIRQTTADNAASGKTTTETMTGMTYDNRGRLKGSTNAISEDGGAALAHNYTVTTSAISYSALGQITGQIRTTTADNAASVKTTTETMTGMTYDTAGRLRGSVNAISETGAGLDLTTTTIRDNTAYDTLGQTKYYKDTTVSSAAPDKVTVREFGVDEAGVAQAPVYDEYGRLEDYYERVREYRIDSSTDLAVSGNATYSASGWGYPDRLIDGAINKWAYKFGVGSFIVSLNSATYLGEIALRKHPTYGYKYYIEVRESGSSDWRKIISREDAYYSGAQTDSFLPQEVKDIRVTFTAMFGDTYVYVYELEAYEASQLVTTTTHRTGMDYNTLGQMKYYKDEVVSSASPDVLTTIYFGDDNAVYLRTENMVSYKPNGQMEGFTQYVTEECISDPAKLDTWTKTIRSAMSYNGLGQAGSYTESIVSSATPDMVTTRDVSNMTYHENGNASGYDEVTTLKHRNTLSLLDTTAVRTKTVISGMTQDGLGRVTSQEADNYRWNGTAFEWLNYVKNENTEFDGYGRITKRINTTYVETGDVSSGPPTRPVTVIESTRSEIKTTVFDFAGRPAEQTIDNFARDLTDGRLEWVDRVKTEDTLDSEGRLIERATTRYVANTEITYTGTPADSAVVAVSETVTTNHGFDFAGNIASQTVGNKQWNADTPGFELISQVTNTDTYDNRNRLRNRISTTYGTENGVVNGDPSIKTNTEYSAWDTAGNPASSVIDTYSYNNSRFEWVYRIANTDVYTPYGRLKSRISVTFVAVNKDITYTDDDIDPSKNVNTLIVRDIKRTHTKSNFDNFGNNKNETIETESYNFGIDGLPNTGDDYFEPANKTVNTSVFTARGHLAYSVRETYDSLNTIIGRTEIKNYVSSFSEIDPVTGNIGAGITGSMQTINNFAYDENTSGLVFTNRIINDKRSYNGLGQFKEGRSTTYVYDNPTPSQTAPQQASLTSFSLVIVKNTHFDAFNNPDRQTMENFRYDSSTGNYVWKDRVENNDTYDPQGRVLGRVMDVYKAGDPDVSYFYSRTQLDAFGTTFDSGTMISPVPVLSEKIVITNSGFDAFGNPGHVVTDNYKDDGGTLKFIKRAVNDDAYNALGRLETRTSITKIAADPAQTYTPAAPPADTDLIYSAKNVITYGDYDAFGNAGVENIKSYLHDGSGFNWQSSVRNVNTYDSARGYVKERVITVYEDEAMTDSKASTRTVIKNENLDPLFGNARDVTINNYKYNGADFVWIGRSIDKNEYDNRGRLTKRVSTAYEAPAGASYTYADYPAPSQGSLNKAGRTITKYDLFNKYANATCVEVDNYVYAPAEARYEFVNKSVNTIEYNALGYTTKRTTGTYVSASGILAADPQDVCSLAGLTEYSKTIVDNLIKITVSGNDAVDDDAYYGAEDTGNFTLSGNPYDQTVTEYLYDNGSYLFLNKQLIKNSYAGDPLGKDVSAREMWTYAPDTKDTLYYEGGIAPTLILLTYSNRVGITCNIFGQTLYYKETIKEAANTDAAGTVFAETVKYFGVNMDNVDISTIPLTAAGVESAVTANKEDPTYVNNRLTDYGEVAYKHNISGTDLLNVLTVTKRADTEYDGIGRLKYYEDTIRSTAAPDKITVREFGFDEETDQRVAPVYKPSGQLEEYREKVTEYSISEDLATTANGATINANNWSNLDYLIDEKSTYGMVHKCYLPSAVTITLDDIYLVNKFILKMDSTCESKYIVEVRENVSAEWKRVISKEDKLYGGEQIDNFSAEKAKEIRVTFTGVNDWFYVSVKELEIYAPSLISTTTTHRENMTYSKLGDLVYYKDTAASSAAPDKTTTLYFGDDDPYGFDP
ncbi:MAG: hypothetical protein KKG95_08070, partial [Candidatus Omnitrophica bacterium]|nr:hypothetical protein [Candidatus Omnitrophota bacterium]